MQNTVQNCPLCGNELSTVKFAEIEAKIKDQKQQAVAEQKKILSQAEAKVRLRLEQEFNDQLKTEKERAAKLATQELGLQLKKSAAERDEAARKAKDAEARELAVRTEAEKEKEAATKAAKQKADEEIKKMAAQRDEATKKLKEAARQTETLQQAKQDAERKYQEELGKQRDALEKDRSIALLKQQASFNRDRESLQKKIKVMEHQLQNKTANEIGEGGEIDVFESLREAFPGDRIVRIKKGQPGADILHEVLHKGESCGRILIDSKLRQAWQAGFITKLRQDQIEADAEQAILATSVFPSGKKEMYIESDVIVVNPARIVHILHILRQAMIAMHIRGLSMKERAGKMHDLYALITSESYRRMFNEAGKLTRDILDLDVQEKKTHDNVWRKRGTLATRINNVLREIETDVAAVVERGDESLDKEYALTGVKIAASSVPALRR